MIQILTSLIEITAVDRRLNKLNSETYNLYLHNGFKALMDWFIYKFVKQERNTYFDPVSFNKNSLVLPPFSTKFKFFILNIKIHFSSIPKYTKILDKDKPSEQENPSFPQNKIDSTKKNWVINFRMSSDVIQKDFVYWYVTKKANLSHYIPFNIIQKMWINAFNMLENKENSFNIHHKSIHSFYPIQTILPVKLLPLQLI